MPQKNDKQNKMAATSGVKSTWVAPRLAREAIDRAKSGPNPSADGITAS